MNEEVDAIIEKFRQDTYNISSEELVEVLELCRRKMDLTGKPDGYLLLLLPDELKNYCIRLAVNAKTSLKIIGKEPEKCAVCV